MLQHLCFVRRNDKEMHLHCSQQMHASSLQFLSKAVKGNSYNSCYPGLCLVQKRNCCNNYDFADGFSAFPKCGTGQKDYSCPYKVDLYPAAFIAQGQSNEAKSSDTS